MSPRWRSCSGRRLRLPGEPVVIEKLAVVGDTFPADETDLFAAWLNPPREDGEPTGFGMPVRRPKTIVGEPAGDDEWCDVPPNESGAPSSSCMSIDMFDGSEAKSEDEALARLRLGSGIMLSYGISGEASGEWRGSA